MEPFTLQKPVDAIRYVKNGNEREIGDLLRRGGRRLSFSNATGVFHLEGDGLDLTIEEGQWLVALGPSAVVLDDADFATVFTPAESI